MNISDAIVQGIVQGITEFLPVSSSGHLLITQHILGVRENNLFFNVMLHIGTLLSVIAVYHKTIWKLIVAFFEILKSIFTGNFNLKKLSNSQNMVLMLIIGLLPLVFMFLPVPTSGMNIKGVAEEISSDKNIILVGICLIITSFLLKLGINSQKSAKFSYAYKTIDNQTKIWNGKTKFTIMDSIYVGVVQFIAAIFPGISRSGSTLSTALLRGINKQTALDYSFILGTPAIIAAAALEIKDAVELGDIYSVTLAPLIVGMAVSAIVGFLSIILFKWLLKTNNMTIFVVYTLVIGIAALVIGVIEQFIGFNIFTGFSI